MSKDILEIIRTRKSSRGIFDKKRPVTGEELIKILEAARWASTAHNMQNFEFIVIDDKDTIKKLAAIRYTLSKAFLKENTAQMSVSREEWQKRKTGLLMESVIPSLMEPTERVAKTSLNEFIPWWDKVISSSSYLVVIVYDSSRRAPGSDGDFLGIMSLGCVFQNVWLMATALGIDFHAVSVLGEPPVDKEVKEVLAIPSHLRVALAFRIGHRAGESVKHATVRRDIEDFTYYNNYGIAFRANLPS